ncbi:Gfo/Idh/MocA family protein [Cerasicoccus arenae]|uniref:Oxidoreductase n=1 Tax=Cerasicoccus arenae TaxID=424488 RepID=A0A8J3DEG2_9BACT|nr:Gfo/Idh/MocA family oxidoreductase [Cerasicoccus arenae]MBK1857729.1 Gfo/Idh/MocA family oxidoreductase [Cerasicoccus arenae]GHB91140.1 oxidoreductase [Cerasicoccus arenae]
MNNPPKATHPPIKILLIGIGGYGNRYVEEIQELEALGEACLSAIVEPSLQAAPSWPVLEQRGIPTFASLDEFIQNPVKVDLAIVVSPISYHADQTCTLLDANIHVLCEKPIAATVSDALRMQETRDRSGCILEIGYQWSFSDTIQNLKKDILSGDLGTAEKLLTRVCWPRGSRYFGRNNWAGKNYNLQGEPVYDSPVNNATAHYLHNMLFVLGSEQNLSATPFAVTAECYRANQIENYDTACCRFETQEGTDVYFYTTHACENADGPCFMYLFENAKVEYRSGGNIIATFKNGVTRDYGNPDHNSLQKINHCIRRIQNPALLPCCSVEPSIAHTKCVQALQNIQVENIDPLYIRKKRNSPVDTLTYVTDMELLIKRAFEAHELFSEQQVEWAKPAQRIDISVTDATMGTSIL